MSVHKRVLPTLAIVFLAFLGVQGTATAKQVPTNEEIFAYIPEQRSPEALLDLCREKLVKHPYDECRVFVLIEDARERGVLEPGAYTKAELEAILGTSLDPPTSSHKAKNAAAKRRKAAKRKVAKKRNSRVKRVRH